MYSTALSLTLPDLPNEQRTSHLADAPLLSLYEAFAAVPDPRSKHGQRYNLPYLLTCLVAARHRQLQLPGGGRTMVWRPLPAPATGVWATRLLYPDGFPLSSPPAPLECRPYR